LKNALANKNLKPGDGNNTILTDFVGWDWPAAK